MADTGAPKSQKAVGIRAPPPSGISNQERRWAILRWLSIKLRDAPHGEVLEAAETCEAFVVVRIAGPRPSKEVLARIDKIAASARRIISAAAEAELDFEEFGPLKLRKPNRISRKRPRALRKRYAPLVHADKTPVF